MAQNKVGKGITGAYVTLDAMKDTGEKGQSRNHRIQPHLH